MTEYNYSQWRQRTVAAQVCEVSGETPPERLLQSIWQHQRLQREELKKRITARYCNWPPAQDNSILKLARQRLFGAPHRLVTAAAQQGLIQITRDYCDHAPATCDDCQFPDLVRGIN